ncbi:hypothetical protein, partial [Burkholderia ubonensis]|uniref:hypothetical protein n=1 Tax=Burkholderia ubonensis TaxID=101571 RepID=UPI001E3C9118
STAAKRSAAAERSTAAERTAAAERVAGAVGILDSVVLSRVPPRPLRARRQQGYWFYWEKIHHEQSGSQSR